MVADVGSKDQENTAMSSSSKNENDVMKKNTTYHNIWKVLSTMDMTTCSNLSVFHRKNWKRLGLMSE